MKLLIVVVFVVAGLFVFSCGKFRRRWAKVRKVLIFESKSLKFWPGTNVAPFSSKNTAMPY